jgi:hypothetical protein
MSSVKLKLPEEIIAELDLPYEGVRDLQGIVIAVEGINVAASLVTLAALRPRGKALVAAIRRWRLRQPQETMLLTVTGPGVDIKIELPANVHSADLFEQLRPLLDGD